MTEDPKPPAHRPKRRSLLKLGVGLGTLAALGGGGWHAWRTWGVRPAGDGFISATVQRASIEDLVTATGALQPRNYVDVGAQVSGQLRKLHVDVGSEVNEGDLLAEIDAETSAARVDASRAQLRSLQAQLGERELNLAKAERDLQRQKNLMAEDATTGETLQNAETTLRTVRAQIESTKAQIQQLQASMRVEEANLKYTRIYAPISGTVVSITSRQGQTLNANQQAPTLLRVADLSTMLVQSQVSEADVTRLRLGMDVYFTTLGGQGRRWYGRLLRIEPTPTVTNNVVLYNALFEVPNPNRSLMTQMTAQVFFVAAEARDVLLVPMSALTMQRGPGGGPGGRGERTPSDAGSTGPITAGGSPIAAAPTGRPPTAQPVAMVAAAPPAPRRPRKAKVRVMKEDGAIEEREVTIGISNRVHAEVIEGLAEGERVIAGVRQPERASGASGQAGGAGPAGGGLGGPPPFGGPGGLPGPMAPGGAGRR